MDRSEDFEYQDALEGGDEPSYARTWGERATSAPARPSVFGRGEDQDEHGREEIRAKELAEYLAGGTMRRLRGDELRERIHDLFRPETTQRPKDANHRHRVVVCWRIARIMARVCGVCAEDELLDDTTNLNPDPWLEGIRPVLNPLQIQLLRRQTSNCLLAVYGSENTRHEGEGVPLLPSKSVKHAERWVRAAEIIVRDTGMDCATACERGLQGMLDPETAVHCGVTRKQIVELEELMVSEAQRIIIDAGERPAVECFRRSYGFTRNEAVGLMRLARSEALRMDGSSIDENRAIMVAQLKDFVSRAKGALSLGEELRALKELAKVQGLTHTEPEDMMRDFLAIVNRVSSRQDREQLPERVIDTPALTARKTEEDEDAEAVAAFDRENRRAG